MKPEGYHLCLARAPEALHRPAPADPSHSSDIGPGDFGKDLARVPLGKDGLVLGALFDAAGTRLERVHPAASARWCATDGAALIRDCWGRYLAILRVADGLLVVRDPSGGFPCFWQARGDRVELFSDLAWADRNAVSYAGIDWAEIRAQLQFRHRRSTRTAFAGIAELLPGCALRISATCIRQEVLWSPYTHARWQTDLGFEDATDRLRAAVRTTLTAEAHQCAKPLISLSGGLDSSIVTACVAEANPGTECLSLQGGDADLDEGGYAEAVARHYGAPLHRARLDTQLVDFDHSAAADMPYPNARSFSQAEDIQTRRAAEEIGADALLLGNGGDTIFWYFNTATAAVDRYRAQGLMAALETAGDLARMCEVGKPTILRSALTKLPRHAPQPWPQTLSLLGLDGLAPAAPPEHPWEVAPDYTPLGVHAYVRALIQLQAHHGYFDRAAFAPVRCVLMAQPIYEACLAIPSWLSSRDGRNRAVARAAFAEFLPKETIARQSKGGFDGFVHQMLARNRAKARSILLGGLLDRHGVIDSTSIDALLRDGASIAAEPGLRILRFVAVEAWLRQQVARGRC
jgi:asparagine synthase (glutamine-hydrolysing)